VTDRRKSDLASFLAWERQRGLAIKWVIFFLGFALLWALAPRTFLMPSALVHLLVFMLAFLVYTIAVSRLRRFPTRALWYISIGLELLYVSALVYFTGGLDSILILMYPLVLGPASVARQQVSDFIIVGLFGHVAYSVSLYLYYDSLSYYFTVQFWAPCLLLGAIFGIMMGTCRIIISKNMQLQDLTEELQAKNKQLARLSVTDGLTGLYNYRYFQQRLVEEMVRARRRGSPLTLLMIDVDYFKLYNDRHGHPMGDRVLRELGSLLQESVRQSDVVARYGGEEFAIILPDTDTDEGLVIAERLRENVEARSFWGEEDQPKGRLTVSVGIATYPTNAADVDELVKRADKALYKAKERDKNATQRYYSLLEDMEGELTEEEARAMHTAEALLAVIGGRDNYTYGHSERVVNYALALAEVLGLSEQELREVKYAAFLHDIGKIELDRKILNKPGRLTEEEYEEVRLHVVHGEDIVRSLKGFGSYQAVIRYHHERFDGQGYPDGLKGQDIPLAARIVAVADAFDAMRSDRPYRKAMSVEGALREILRGAGSQFDPHIAKEFARFIRRCETGQKLWALLKQDEATLVS